jgi:hypothetical protein
MAKPTTTNSNATAAAFTEAQMQEIRAIVADFLINDEFDVQLNHKDVVDACKVALQDKEVQTSLSEVLKK